MSLKDDLTSKIAEIFEKKWTERDGQVVPEYSDLKLTNDAVNLDAVVLYADMSESTKLVNRYRAYFAGEVYKSYLYCSAKIIRSEGGEITAYDGDRIMAVFVGKSKNTSAVRAALKINYARICIINPGIKAQYKNCIYQLEHVIGIDASKLFIARTGIRGSNDLVWVGRSANHAAKLCSLPATYAVRITKKVYDKLHKNAKIDSNGKDMWQRASWKEMGIALYRSRHYWIID